MLKIYGLEEWTERVESSKVRKESEKAMSTHGRRRGPCAWTFEICFTNVHFLAMSKRGHLLSPRMDISFQQGCSQINSVSLQYSIRKRFWSIFRATKNAEWGKMKVTRFGYNLSSVKLLRRTTQEPVKVGNWNCRRHSDCNFKVISWITCWL
jgi:hypothetical protein